MGRVIILVTALFAGAVRVAAGQFPAPHGSKWTPDGDARIVEALDPPAGTHLLALPPTQPPK